MNNKKAKSPSKEVISSLSKPDFAEVSIKFRNSDQVTKQIYLDMSDVLELIRRINPQRKPEVILYPWLEYIFNKY